LIAAIVFAVYSIWDAGQVFEAADPARYVAYRPNAEDTDRFRQLRNMNPDVFAWLTVRGTQIDYPVVHTTDNSRYLNVNAVGDYASSGAIFLDYRNTESFDDFNSIIYGHHMEKGRMFGQLSDFADESFFRSHSDGVLYYDGSYHDVAFFAFIQTDAYDRELFQPAVAGEEEREAYISGILSCASVSRELPVTPEDQLIVLTTCASTVTNGRHMLFGKITGETPPGMEGNNIPVNRGKGLQFTDRTIKAVPLWVWAAVDLLLILLLTVLWAVLRRRRAAEKPSEGS